MKWSRIKVAHFIYKLELQLTGRRSCRRGPERPCRPPGGAASSPAGLPLHATTELYLRKKQTSNYKPRNNK